MPTDVNVDLSAVDAAAEKIQNEELTNTEDELSTGHKVLFYIFLGALCLLGVGVPVLVFLLIKKSKECKKLKDEAEKKEAAPAETNAAEGSETENKGEEPKAETKPEPEKEDKKKK